MRTTLILKEDLYREAVKATGVEEKTKLIHMGLEALIRNAAIQRLVNLRGKIKNAWAPSRRKRIWS